MMRLDKKGFYPRSYTYMYLIYDLGFTHICTYIFREREIEREREREKKRERERNRHTGRQRIKNM